MRIFHYISQTVEYFIYKILRLFKKETPIEPQPYLYEDGQQILEEYGDEVPIGVWGICNAETGESEIKGELLSQTVKFKNPDGSVHIDTKWYPDQV